MYDDITTAGRLVVPSVLYHYTSAQGLKGIVESGKLWATHIRYLNDLLEYEFLWELLSTRIQTALDSSNEEVAADERSRLRSLLARRPVEVFVASFSNDGGDRLSQWRGYSPDGNGYSIGFSRKVLQDFAESNNRVTPPGAPKADIFQVKYCASNDAKLFDGIVEGTWKNPLSVDTGVSAEQLFTALTSVFAPLYKHVAFEEEKEWRLTLSSVGTQTFSEHHNASSKIHFRPGKSMMIPYREIDLRSIETDFISEITIGPTPHKDLSKQAVEELLRSVGHKVCEIKNSDVPYRFW
jgi:hypothetical protein